MASPVGSGEVRRLEIRKYPNRRYYDSSRRQHLTLEDIYALVRDGYEVRVTESKTGEDITARILTQIILEIDPPKLGIFSAELLHQVIRASEPLIRDFVEKYFSQAFSAFLQSQQHLELYLRDAMGLQSQAGVGASWARLMMSPFLPPFLPASSNSAAAPPAAADPEVGELRRTVDQLQQQLLALEQRLERHR